MRNLEKPFIENKKENHETSKKERKDWQSSEWSAWKEEQGQHRGGEAHTEHGDGLPGIPDMPGGAGCEAMVPGGRPGHIQGRPGTL